MNKFYGKYEGIVDDNDDPLKMGRLKVKVPEVCGSEELNWAMPCIQAGTKRGGFFLLQKNDPVWVEFKGGNVEYPIWCGSWWIQDGVPDGASIDKEVFQTTSGHKLEFDIKNKSLNIVSPDNQKITLDDKKGVVKIVDSSGQSILMDGKRKKIKISNSALNTDYQNMGEGGVGGFGSDFGGISEIGNVGDINNISDISTAVNQLGATVSQISDVRNVIGQVSDLARKGIIFNVMEASNVIMAYGKNQLATFIGNNALSLVSSIATPLRSLATDIVNVGHIVVNANHIATLSSIADASLNLEDNFQKFYDTAFIPSIVMSESIDSQCVDIVNQGVDGVIANIGTMKDAITNSLSSQITSMKDSMTSIYSGKLETFISSYGGSTLTAASSQLLKVNTDSITDINSIGGGLMDNFNTDVVTGAVDMPIMSVNSQSIEIDSTLGKIELSDSTGQNIKLDSLQQEVSLSNSSGCSVTIGVMGIDINSSGKGVRLV